MCICHNRIVFDFLYSEYRHNKRVLSFGVNAKVHSIEGMWVCVLVIVFFMFRFTAIFPFCFSFTDAYDLGKIIWANRFCFSIREEMEELPDKILKIFLKSRLIY